MEISARNTIKKISRYRQLSNTSLLPPKADMAIVPNLANSGFQTKLRKNTIAHRARIQV
jgi:hypothetical protein